MFDRVGKELRLGQSIDIHLNGMYTGTIIDIREIPLAVSKNQLAPPQIAIQMVLTHVPKDGRNCGVYVVAEPEASTEKPKIELVQ